MRADVLTSPTVASAFRWLTFAVVLAVLIAESKCGDGDELDLELHDAVPVPASGVLHAGEVLA